ncbi:MAG TPA: hypothetical protein VLB07_12710, partial [Woeseiaceae bacterium]|nr:hypothetical protein [Woeseiaceae bacterium]
MKLLPRLRLRHVGIALASLLLAMIAAAALVLGTETGTRWVLDYAVRFVPGELDIADYDGTLLRGLRISRMDYNYAAIRLSADELIVKPDWLRSNRGRIALRQLAADRISYSSTKPADEQPKPLQIGMPALPINIAVADLSTRELQVGERLFSDLAASDVRLHGNRVRAERVSGRMGRIQADFGRLDTTLSADVPLQADVSWRLGDGPWSGKGRVDGTLAELGFEQAVTGSYPAQVSGTVYLLRRIEPAVDAGVRYDRWQFGDLSASNGQLQVTGTVNAYRVVLETGVSDAQARSLLLTGEVSGDAGGLRAIDVVASAAAGRVSARGTLEWSPSFSTDLVMQAQGIDPAQVAGLKPGALDAELRLEARGGRDFVLQIDALTGSYDGQA